MIYYEISKFLQNHHKTVLVALFIWVYGCADRPSLLVKLSREVPDGNWNRGGGAGSPATAMSAGWGPAGQLGNGGEALGNRCARIGLPSLVGDGPERPSHAHGRLQQEMLAGVGAPARRRQLRRTWGVHEHRGDLAHAPVVAARSVVARGFAATCDGGCDRGHPRQASAGGCGPRRRAARAPGTTREAEGRVNEARALPSTLGKAGRVARAWTRGCTAWSPRRHFTEHMAGAEVGRLGRLFGPFPSWSGSWA
jgi:hypothetical protein